MDHFDQIKLLNLTEEVLIKILEYKTIVSDLRSAIHLNPFNKGFSKGDKGELVVELMRKFLSMKWYTVEMVLEQG